MSGLMIYDHLMGKEYKKDFWYIHGVDPNAKDENGIIGRTGTKNVRMDVDDFHSLVFDLGVISWLDKPINRISVYKECSNLPVYHAFVIMETNSGAFCLERLCNSTSLRHAKDAETLINFGVFGERKSKLLTENSRASGTIKDVIQFVCDEGISTNPYNLIKNNCLKLAKKVFGRFNVDGNVFHTFRKEKKQRPAAPAGAEAAKTSVGFFESLRRIKRFASSFSF